jgi:hypothetical protein
MSMSRRSFVGSVGASVAALGTLAASAEHADAQLIYMPNDWHMAEFDKLLKSKARVKQVFDVSNLAGGEFMSPIKNSINGLQFGFKIPVDQINVVAALRGSANLLNFDDSMWEKYQLGEYTKTDDPKTSKPATRNLFFLKKEGATSDVQDHNSIYQDYSVQALTPRGLTLLSCHNATTNAAGRIIKKLGLKVEVDEVVKDLQSHMLPGVISVPAMVSAIAMLQCEGKFAYTTG